MVFPCPVHTVPSGEVAIVCVPSPTATQRLPFHAAARPLENGDTGSDDHVMPSDDIAVGVAPPPHAIEMTGESDTGGMDDAYVQESPSNE